MGRRGWRRDDRRSRWACPRARTRPRSRPRAAAQGLVRELLERIDLPAVVDADGLFELEPVERSAPTVLTPHAGELGRLLGRDSEWVDAHRLEAAREAAARFGTVVLLKGTDTIVSVPDGETVVSDFGSAVPRDCRHGGRADRRDRGVSRQGRRARRRGYGGRVAHGLAASAAPHPGRPGRERPARPAPGRARTADR